MSDKKINVIMLAAGSEQGLQNDGFPTCLTELDGVPLIQKLVNACSSLSNSMLMVCFSKAECDRYHLDDIVKLLKENSSVVKIPAMTQGAACTALLCVENIKNDDELLIINGNEFIDVNFDMVVQGFRKHQLDAGVMVFHSIHPRYSYVKLNAEGLVTEASEKRPISDLATTGFYWFSKGKQFVSAAINMIKKDARVNDNFYICPTFNEMILDGYKIGTHRIDERNYYPLKDLKQMHNFEFRFERNAQD